MKSKIFIVLIAGLIFCSCTDLDLNPLSEGSSGNWFSNTDELEMSANYMYSLQFWENWETGGWGSWEAYLECWTDDEYGRNNLTPLTNATINGQTRTVENWWTKAYQCIASANQILKNMERSKENITEANYYRYMAEARFVRAAQYSHLITLFGDVPYYSNVLTIDEAFTLSKTSKSEILQKIYEDFDFAALHLPLSYSGTEPYRATKGAVYAMKTRIALYMGDWSTAINAAKACMDLGIYQLHPNFSDLFITKNTKEIIFAIPRSEELGISANSTAYLPRSVGGVAKINPTWSLLHSFLCTDGLPIDESPLYDPRFPFKNRDPRCTATIVEWGTRHAGIIYQPHPDSLKTWSFDKGIYISNLDNRAVNQYGSYNGLVWKKWVQPNWWNGDGRMEIDNVIIRYADVLLMYAEAKIEKNEIDQSVRDAINKVRARAYGVDYNNTSAYPAVVTNSQSDLRKIIRLERRVELAKENRRMYDILRWRLAEKVLNTPVYGLLQPADLRTKIVNTGKWIFPMTPPIDEDGIPDFKPMYDAGFCIMISVRSFDPGKNYLMPIPTKEILINDNIEQNPNY